MREEILLQWRMLGFKGAARLPGKTAILDDGNDITDGKDTNDGLKDLGLYKLRVRVAEDRVQRISGNQRKTGNFPELKRVSVGSQKDKGNADGEMIQQFGLTQVVNEEVGSCDKQVTKQHDQPGNEIIEFSPKKEECQWLDGSMIAVVRSLELVIGIQARMDVDGGLIILAPLGGRRMLLLERTTGYLDEYMRQNKELFETWFESICPWEMAPKQSGRLEEWRLDPDWWLSTGDRSSTSETESEYSSSQNRDEDLELINTEISGEEADNIDEALSTDVGNLNIQGNHIIEGDGSYEMEYQRGVVMGGDIGSNKFDVIRPLVDRQEGLGADDGLENSGSHEWIMGKEGNEPKGINAKKIHYG
ncbi:hypothetical protein SLEP1_g46478 [Rubroshorea leprosula]|uniref:Uncharacterized protein n=1 Tax=Rubroshorea leprosula TaxID=152421 RepID=A0AAV5LMC3_9ROSI|nr:hypothetical protein SLEP1_g46478 [Rubroshorea leprosula]